MKKILLTLALLFLTNLAKAQVVVIHFNAAWNAAHDVEWIEDLSDCDIEYIDIAKKPALQKEYSIVVVPTIVVLQYDEEKKRYQADLSFKLNDTKDEVQEMIDELILSGF
jgi:hypothetical protein